MKTKPAYYSVHVTKDGTIVLAMPCPKPHQSPRSRRPEHDEDGCRGWYPWDLRKTNFSEMGKTVALGALASHLNLKKTLREKVEPRLQTIESRLDEMAAVLSRLEAALIATTPSPSSPQ